jgi:hypothetical protein
MVDHTDLMVSAKPIRLYHGIADDWVPVGPCRDYVQERTRRSCSSHMTNVISQDRSQQPG